MQFDEKKGISSRIMDWIAVIFNFADIYSKLYQYNKKNHLLISKKYLLKLSQNPTSELFKNTDKNLIEVSSEVTGNNLIANKKFQVELEITIDGMLGFGEELIRLAMHAKQNKTNSVFDSLNRKKEKQALFKGTYSTKITSELVLSVNDNLKFRDIDKIENKLKQEEIPVLTYLLEEEKTQKYQEKYENLKKFPRKKPKEKFSYEKWIEDQRKQFERENYLVELYPDLKKGVEFEIRSKNFVKVNVYQINSKPIQEILVDSNVNFSLTQDGMLKFGETLIRKAMTIKSKKHDDDCKNNTKATQLPKTFTPHEIGLYLTSDSLPLLITIKDLEELPKKLVLKSNKFIWAVDNRLNYVFNIIGRNFLIIADSTNKQKIIKALGGRRSFILKNIWLLKYSCKKDGIKKLQYLRDANFMFSGGGRNIEAFDEFCYLRDKGYVKGSVLHIGWQTPDKIIIENK